MVLLIVGVIGIVAGCGIAAGLGSIHEDPAPRVDERGARYRGRRLDRD